MSSEDTTLDERILILAPLWRDAQVACTVLAQGGFTCHACSDMAELSEEASAGAGAILLTAEALDAPTRDALLALLQEQPSWSDLPIILLLASTQLGPDQLLNAVDVLPGHNVTLLRRPVPSTILRSVVDASLRARRRQYQLREYIQQREQYTGELEARVRARTQKLQELNDQYEAARDLFLTLFQANPLPIAIVRLDNGSVMDANRAFLDFFQATRDSVVDRSVADLRHMVPEQFGRDILNRLQRFGAVHNLETTTINGADARTVLVSAELVTLQGNDVALVTFVDISERKQAEETIRNLASELARAEHRERHRISQILHDDLQQQLYGMQMQLVFLRDEASESMLAELDAIDPTIDQAIKIVRDLSVDLSPPILYDEGLVQGIQWIANRMQEQYRLDVKVHAAHSFPIADDGQRVLLVQIVRELLFNAVKHAGVSSVDVNIEESGGQTRIEVVDDGAGFDVQILEQDRSSIAGRGLRSARERLRLVGGQLHIESSPGEGTRVTITTPSP